MKIRIAWFLIGVVVSWMTWYAMNYVRLLPRNYRGNLSEVTLELEEGLAEFGKPGLQWLGHAHGRRLGNYKVVTPADSLNASAMFESVNARGLPGIMIADEDANGTLDSIVVIDSAERTFKFVDTNGDGTFDTYEYNTGFDMESKVFRDDNMDGQYDIRFGPGRSIAVFIDSKWRTATFKDDKWFVKIEGKMTPVELSPVKKLTTNE
jgi:hypothetical protein